MARRNIFQLVEDSYDIQNEIAKINKLFKEEDYFEAGYLRYSLYSIVDKVLFTDWKYRGTCINVEEYLNRAGAFIQLNKRANEEQIINNLEVMENFVKLYFDNAESLHEEQNIKYFRDFDTVFCDLINTLEKRMGLTTREYKDRIIIYPKNASLDKVIDLCDEEDVQWELIRYVRENMNLTEKRKSLAYLATNLYIEQDSKENDSQINVVIDKTTNILNNLHIRHSNKTGKWATGVLDTITDTEAISLCDMAYNNMLIIVLMRDNKKYESTYNVFNKNQKNISAMTKKKQTTKQ